jgi:hypothetical protein
MALKFILIPKASAGMKMVLFLFLSVPPHAWCRKFDMPNFSNHRCFSRAVGSHRAPIEGKKRQMFGRSKVTEFHNRSRFHFSRRKGYLDRIDCYLASVERCQEIRGYFKLRC